jgi:Arc/MetJ-type ribon-helix-helix transcriptional regulator
MVDHAAIVKVTFSLPLELVRSIREAVARGSFPSQNSMVREALTRELGRMREKQLYEEFVEAAADPLFMQDIDEAQQAFAGADSETARMIPNG